MFRRAFFITLLLLVGMPTVASAQSTVVLARQVGDDGPWPACGMLAVEGTFEFELIRAEKGSTTKRFLVRIDCPLGKSFGGVQRLTLDDGVVLSELDPSAPAGQRLHTLAHSELAEAPPGLGRALRDNPTSIYSFKADRSDGDWYHFGSVLSLRLVDNVIVELRARPAKKMKCLKAAEWMGFEDAPKTKEKACRWSGEDAETTLLEGYEAWMKEGWFVLKKKRTE